MHNIEPHHLWRGLYVANEDLRSPFYGYENSEVNYTDSIYNHIIHPQWDFFGPETLYMKQLYADYNLGYTVLEFFGEWNDILHNDIMFLKRDVIEPMIDQGINKFILLGDNLLNFHAGDADYYEEWFDQLDDGWISLINFREHVLTEIRQYNLDSYLNFGGDLDYMAWQGWEPKKLYQQIDSMVSRRLA